MTQAVYTVGKAPCAYGPAKDEGFTSEMEAFQAWQHWREKRLVSQKIQGVYRWPNGIRNAKGKARLEECVKVEKPKVVDPYDPKTIPAPAEIGTKAETERLLAKQGPMSAATIGANLNDMVAYVEDLERQIAVKDARIAELEADLAFARADRSPAEENDAVSVLAREMAELRAKVENMGKRKEDFPGLFDQVKTYANGGKAHG